MWKIIILAEFFGVISVYQKCIEILYSYIRDDIDTLKKEMIANENFNEDDLIFDSSFDLITSNFLEYYRKFYVSNCKEKEIYRSPVSVIDSINDLSFSRFSRFSRFKENNKNRKQGYYMDSTQFCTTSSDILEESFNEKESVNHHHHHNLDLEESPFPRRKLSFEPQQQVGDEVLEYDSSRSRSGELETLRVPSHKDCDSTCIDDEDGDVDQTSDKLISLHSSDEIDSKNAITEPLVSVSNEKEVTTNQSKLEINDEKKEKPAIFINKEESMNQNENLIQPSGKNQTVDAVKAAEAFENLLTNIGIRSPLPVNLQNKLKKKTQNLEKSPQVDNSNVKRENINHADHIKDSNVDLSDQEAIVRIGYLILFYFIFKINYRNSSLILF
jgi:hypothetical protein